MRLPEGVFRYIRDKLNGYETYRWTIATQIGTWIFGIMSWAEQKSREGSLFLRLREHVVVAYHSKAEDSRSVYSPQKGVRSIDTVSEVLRRYFTPTFWLI
jgi:hypothetical protein